MYKKSLINFTSSLIYQITTLLVGLILPKYYTEIFGSIYNGLNQAISQTLGLLAIVQYGIAAAAIQALFRPIAENDQLTIALIYRKIERQYRTMGYLFLLLLIPIVFIFPFIIKDNISYWIVFVLFVLRGLSSAIEYFFQAKYGVLLIANNRSYIIYSVNILLQIISVFFHLSVLFTLKNIILYQSIALVITLLRLLIVDRYVKKEFPFIFKVYVNSDNKDVQIKQRKDVLISEVAGLAVDSTDLIVLSSFAGLVAASIYSVYNFVILGLKGFLGSAREAVIASLGKFYYTNKMLFVDNMLLFESIYLSIMFFLYSVAIVLFQPFVSVYTMNMDTEYDIDGLPILFVISAILVGLRIPAIVSINISGHFKEVKSYAVFEALIKISLSLAFVIEWGIYGVLTASILAALYRTPILIYYSYKHILEISIRQYLKKIFCWFILFLGYYIFSCIYSFEVDNFFEWIYISIIIVLISIIIFIFWIKLFDTNMYQYIRLLINKYEKNN